jgi:hypothetical protein
MDAAKFKMENEQCNRVLVVLKFLAESHCQAHITAIKQARTQVRGARLGR